MAVVFVRDRYRWSHLVVIATITRVLNSKFGARDVLSADCTAAASWYFILADTVEYIAMYGYT